MQPLLKQDTTKPSIRLKELGKKRSRFMSELTGAVISASLALTGAGAVFRLWRAHIDVPISPGASDTLFILMLVKNIQTTGWFQGTPNLGAPFGQDLTGFPGMLGDTWHILVLKTLSTFLSPAATVNVFFILMFPLIAAVAYGCLRVLRVSRPFACALGAVYAWLPYHFLRSEGHLFLSAYYAIPVACVLAVALYNDRLTLWANPGPKARIAWYALAGTLLLTGTTYYAAFTMVLLMASGVLGSLATRKWRPMLSGGVLVAVMSVGLILAALPNLLRTVPLGDQIAGEGRSYLATEVYGLKITNLLLPIANHRIPALADLRTHAANTLITGEGGTETLGILGVVGLIAVILAILLPMLSHNSELVQHLQPLGAMAILSLLFGTVAGLNSMFAVFGFAELRAWNRISVLIGFLALAGLGHLLDAGRTRWGGKDLPVQRLVTAGVASLVVIVAFYDQTSPGMAPDYTATTASWNNDDSYFARVQNGLGQGASVFALPYMPFPESWPIVKMTDYSHLRGYLHSDLRWNYGGLKNEASEWQPVALQDGITAGLPKLVVAGFDAIYINRLGYDDSGAKIESEITAVIGPDAPIVNADATLAVYDLRSYAKTLGESATRLPSRASVLNPVQVTYGLGFHGEESNVTDRWRWALGSSQMTLINPSVKATKVVLHGAVHVADATARITVRIGTHETRLRLVDGLAKLEIPATIEPGATLVQIMTDSSATPPSPAVPDSRELRLQLIGFSVVQ